MQQSSRFAVTVLALALSGSPGTFAQSSPEPVKPAAETLPAKPSFSAARQGFVTRLVRNDSPKAPAPQPPAGVLDVVRYRSPVGHLPAYVTPDPKDGKRHPAIVWLAGGDGNSLRDVWTPASADNDQTAAAFRHAGVVTFYPSLRGGNDNPGRPERFLGEVDDVLAATDHLASLPYVDPQRIYLGGHSTGATLALLVAAAGGRYRAVFALGPIDEVAKYGDRYIPFNAANPRELELRSPIRWLHSINTPTYVIEGAKAGIFTAAITALSWSSRNPRLQFTIVRNADHFNVIAPVSKLIAERIVRDQPSEGEFKLSSEALRSLLP